MNTNSKNSRLILFAASVAASVIAVAIRIGLTLTELDVHGLYKRGSILPTVFHSILAVSAIALILFAFVKTPKLTDSYRHTQTLFSRAASALVAVFLIADIVASLYNILKGFATPSAFDVLEIVFALPAAAYFTVAAVKPIGVSAATALSSLFPTAWCAVYLIRIYFDQNLLMTSPGRILDQMALLCAMVCLLTETRALLGKFSHRFFAAACSVAPIMLFTSSVPNLIFPVLTAEGSSYSFIRNALCFAFAVFFVSRLHSYTVLNKPQIQNESANERNES